jgi:hypothetical protein
MGSDITTSDKLKEIIATEHDRIKATWDKKNVVQFKNERIAILKNEHNKQVQFIAAFDQVLKEGYVLIGISPDQAGQSGFSKSMGGGSAADIFYFQKMK